MSNDTKKALIINNSNYQYIDKLQIQDGTVMNSTLKSLGFTTTVHHDLSNYAMKHAIRDFGDELQKGQVILFYYHGHAHQIGSDNYLLGIDTEKEVQEQKNIGGVSFNKTVMQSFNKFCVYIIVLDACGNQESGSSNATSEVVSKQNIELAINKVSALSISNQKPSIWVNIGKQIEFVATPTASIQQGGDANVGTGQKVDEPNLVGQLKQENAILKKQVEDLTQQLQKQKLHEAKNSGSTSKNLQARGFQKFQIPQNQKEINLQQFQNLLEAGKVQNMTLNLTEEDFGKDGEISFKVSKQQVIRGLTINAKCQKNIKILFLPSFDVGMTPQIIFEADCSLTFENCIFNEVQLAILCSHEAKFFYQTFLHQVDLKNVICKINKNDMLTNSKSCIAVAHALKIFTSNLKIENQKGRGLTMHNCSKAEIKQTSVENCSEDGIQIQDCDNASVTDSSFSNCGQVGCYWGRSRGEIRNCNISKCKTGISLAFGAKVYKDDRCVLSQNELDFKLDSDSEWLKK